MTTDRLLFCCYCRIKYSAENTASKSLERMNSSCVPGRKPFEYLWVVICRLLLKRLNLHANKICEPIEVREVRIVLFACDWKLEIVYQYFELGLILSACGVKKQRNLIAFSRRQQRGRMPFSGMRRIFIIQILNGYYAALPWSSCSFDCFVLRGRYIWISVLLN